MERCERNLEKEQSQALLERDTFSEGTEDEDDFGPFCSAAVSGETDVDFMNAHRAYQDMLDAELTMGTELLILVKKKDMVQFFLS